MKQAQIPFMIFPSPQKSELESNVSEQVFCDPEPQAENLQATSIQKSPKKSETAYRTIGEVSAMLSLPDHVLRFWEEKFSTIRPMKRLGRRYYRPQDISALERIKALLYENGYTIRGVQKLLDQEKKPKIVIMEADFISQQLKEIYKDIKDLRRSLI